MNRLFQYIGIFATIALAAYAASYIYKNNINLLDPFFYWAGILAVIATITFLILRILHGKNWVTKSGKAFILGADLVNAIDNTLAELPKPTRPTISNLGGHILYRFTRLGMLALCLALIPIWLLWQQNQKIDLQNDRINIQNSLLEADRRSSLIVMMSNILDKVDAEIKEERTKPENKNIHPDNMRFRLSTPLISRIVALSRAFQPYQKLDGDTLSNKLISPERGQLFIALMENQLDSFTQNSIVGRGNFNNAIIGKINLKGGYFIGADLRRADLIEADLSWTHLSWTDLSQADLRSAGLTKADLRGTDLRKTDLRGANLSGTDLRGADLNSADLNRADLSWTNLLGAYLNGVDLREVDLNGAENLTTEQLLLAKSLYESKNLDPTLKAQLQKERPCLFTEEGCQDK